MPSTPNPLPDELGFAVFSTGEAHRAGVTRGRLQAADLTSLARGLWVRDDRVLSEREIVGALCRRDPAVFAMGLTAARILGMPLPGIFAEEVTAPPQQTRRIAGRLEHRPGRKSVDRRIHLGSTAARGRDTALLRWSRAEAEVVTLPDDPAVRTTTRLRTLLDLASILQRDALVAIGDHLVRAPRPRYEGAPGPSPPSMTCVRPPLGIGAGARSGSGKPWSWCG